MTLPPLRIAVVGLGKIARDQHLPAIAGDNGLVLAATVDPAGTGVAGIPHFVSLDALLAARVAIDAVALCSPPQVRYGLAAAAISAGWHVLLEKPPAATLSQVAALEVLARDAGVTLFAGWHARFAGGVEPARAWLADRRIGAARITWREDVRQWHPGQQWIWDAGGLGVFDPGINALSIATRILPRDLHLDAATLSVPANHAAPIAADLLLRDATGAAVTMDLDWRQAGRQTWEIAVDSDGETLTLSEGGGVLTVAGATHRYPDREYPSLYARFANLVRAGDSDVDCDPLRLVADAFLCGDRRVVEPFDSD